MGGNIANSKVIGEGGSEGDNNVFSTASSDANTTEFRGGNTFGYTQADGFTGSFIIATTRGPNYAGPNPYVETTESFERHVFYWYSASDNPPQLGAYTTHSTTAINLSEPTDFSSGSHDYISIASKSIQVIDAHPSFSYIRENAATDFTFYTQRRYNSALYSNIS